MTHDSSSDELEELASAFALEALSPEERDFYVTHIAHCGLCQRLVSQFHAVSDMLPYALDEEPTSEGLKERILTLASSEIAPNEPLRQAPAAEAGPTTGRRWLAWPTPVPAWAAAFVILVLIGLVAWNISLQLILNDRPVPSPEQRDLIEAIAAGASVFHLSGTEVAPESRGSLIQAQGSQTAFLLVRNLARLPEDREYQVWRIEGDTPIDAGTFRPDDSDTQLLRLNADFSLADAIGVSIEPMGGSAAPTPGAIVLLGAL